jgi:hypothetical protein
MVNNPKISWYVQRKVGNVWQTLAIIQSNQNDGPIGVVQEMTTSALHAPLRKYAHAHAKGCGRIVKLGDLYNVAKGESLEQNTHNVIR